MPWRPVIHFAFALLSFALGLAIILVSARWRNYSDWMRPVVLVPLLTWCVLGGVISWLSGRRDAAMGSFIVYVSWQTVLLTARRIPDDAADESTVYDGEGEAKIHD
jgi:uncharacterized membrane protein